MKLTQPVLLQSFEDEFKLPDGHAPNTPAVPSTILRDVEERNQVDYKEQKIFRSGVGKLLHLKRWSRPEIGNAVRELTRMTGKAGIVHMTAMKRCMKYCIGTAKRGLILKPDTVWDGNPNFEFRITGKSDSDFAKDPSRRSVSGWSTFLCGAPVTEKSNMQPITALSVTEAELIAGSSCVQDMIFEKRILESMGLKVKLPMVLEMDNKGAADLINNWSTGGRTRHIDCRLYFMRELKEEEILKVVWIPGSKNSSDLFTKNLLGPDFERHSADYVGEGNSNDSQGENVGGDQNSTSDLTSE